MKPVPAAPAPAPVESGPATVVSLGQQLRQVLPTRRLHSVSLCDHEANVLWLSEGALGPDEHVLVVEALNVLTSDNSLHIHETGTEDGRLALFLPVRTPTTELVGIAMILADAKSFSDDTLERISAAPVRAIMLRLAVLLKPAAAVEPPRRVEPPRQVESALPDEPDLEAALAAVPAVPLMSSEEVDQMLEFDLPEEKPAKPLPPLRDIPVARPAAAVRLPPPTDAGDADMVSLELLDEPVLAVRPVKPVVAAPAAPPPAPPPAQPTRAAPTPSQEAPARTPPSTVRAPAGMKSPGATQAAASVPAAAPPPAAAPAAAAVVSGAPAEANVQLEVLPFGKLRAGGQTRRFQVMARVTGAARDPAAQDALVLQRLMGWLAAHRAAWNSQPTGFTLNLSIATLEDERFAQKLASALHSHGIAGDTFGFEIAEALCTQRRAQVERFIAQCEKGGAWIVIDNFSFDSQVLSLLRSKAVRVVKIDTKLTSSALKDKLCQAMVVATVQAAKVLGVHCAAKRVDSQAALQWLTAIGCDFAQGAALGGVQSLDSLASSPDPTGLSPVLRPT